MKKIIIILILLKSFYCIFGQSKSKIDSLNKIYLLPQTDTAKVQVLNNLSIAYTKKNIDSSFYYAELAFNLAKKINFSEGILNGYNNYGRALINTGNYQENIKLCKQGLVYVDELLKKSKNINDTKKLQEYKITILRNLGVGFDLLAIYPEALKYYMESLKLQEAIGDKEKSAATYHNIGGVYLDYEKLDEALNYFQKAYKINKEYGNKMWMTNNLVNIAIVYSTLNRNDLALSTYKEALNLFEEEENSAGKLNVLSNIGTLYGSMNVVDSCIFYMKKVLKLNQEIGDPRLEESAYLLLGKMYTNKKEYPKARKMLKDAGKIVHELEDYTLLVDYYEAMYKIDSTQGYLANALRNLQLSYKYRDSVYNEDNIRKLTQTQMNYDFEKKEAESKALQQKKDAIANEELRRQKIVRNGFIGGFMVVMIFAFVFFNQKKKINKEKKKSDELLLNILPHEVAEELKEKGSADAQLINEVTILFTDFKGFTQLSEKLSPKELVGEINECFSAFDHIMEKYGVEKIKTIGDAYMAAGGLPTSNTTHANDVVNATLAIQQYMDKHKAQKQSEGKLFFEIRIGVHSGPVVAGIVGVKKFAYDIWGDTVNTASRMESSGEAGKVNISGTTYELVKDNFICTHRGKVQAKGKGEVDMYFVEGRI